jgi:hypothetical protein
VSVVSGSLLDKWFGEIDDCTITRKI